MKKVGQNDTQSGSEETSSDESDDDSGDGDDKPAQNFSGKNGNQYGQQDYRYNNNGRNGYPNNDMNYYGSMRPNGMNVAGTYASDQNVNQNGYQNWNNQNSFNNYPNRNSSSSSSHFNGNATANNQTERDQACLMHCFFHELRLVNAFSKRFSLNHFNFILL